MAGWELAGAGLKAFQAWTGAKLGRKLFPKRFEKRDAKRAQRQAEKAAAGGEFYEDEDDEMKLLEAIANLRTSTKGGVAGLIPAGVMLLPFAEPVNDYIMQACQAEGGPLPFLVGAGVTWVAFYIAARKSKTPAKPGAI